MIEIKTKELAGFEPAIHGMRNALSSWDKSDSGLCEEYMKIAGCPPWCPNWKEDECLTSFYRIGENDKRLAMNLIKGGSSERKFLRQVMVWASISAPRYWWIEFSTYRIGVESNSTSTMHTIHKKEFTLEDFSTDHLMDSSLCILEEIIERLNFWRIKFIEQTNPDTKNDKYLSAKECWYQMIQLLPQSYNQTRTCCISYEALLHMYMERRYHKQDEWREFCKWVETLPYMEDFIYAIESTKGTNILKDIDELAQSMNMTIQDIKKALSDCKAKMKEEEHL